MYRWLRNTHLLLGLFSSAFVLMFGVSAIRFSHENWFGQKPAGSEIRFTISPEGAATPQGVVQELREKYGLRGEIRNPPQPTDAGYHILITRPGSSADVKY